MNITRKVIAKNKVLDTTLILFEKKEKFFATMDGKDIYTSVSRQDVVDYYTACVEYLQFVASIKV